MSLPNARRFYCQSPFSLGLYFFSDSKSVWLGKERLISVSRKRACLPGQKQNHISDVAGVEEAKDGSARRLVDVLRDPKNFRSSAAAFQRVIMGRADRPRAKRCWSAPYGGRSRCPFCSIRGSDFVEMCGSSAFARPRHVRERQEKSAPLNSHR